MFFIPRRHNVGGIIKCGVIFVQLLNELVSSLATNTVYHWRVRLHYHPATTPFQQYSRWLTMPWNGWQEQDLRTGSTPVIYLPLILRNF